MEVERKLAWIWKPASSNGFFQSTISIIDRVSRKMIKNKALEIFSSVTDSGDITSMFIVTLTLHILKRYAINFLFGVGKDLQ